MSGVAGKVAAGLFGAVAGAVASGIAYWLITEEKDARPSRPAPVSRTAVEREWRAQAPGNVDAPPSYEEAISESMRAQAQEAVGVDPVNHINVCFAGTTGVGKSTLINAFRGINNQHPLAARTSAVQETTSRLQRYDFPEHKSEALQTLAYLKLWDVPGSGTDSFSWTDYFNQLKLYVFDFIVIVCSDRLTTADVELAMQAHQHEIPFAFVRSRADEAVFRYKNDTGKTSDAEAAAEIKATFKDICCAKLRDRGVTQEPPTYLVSSYAMTDTSRRLMKNDEDKLLKDVLRVVLRRRN